MALGYGLECSGLGDNKPGKTLPAWKNWGDLFVKGFFAFLISLIYGIPVLILTLIIFGGTVLEMAKAGTFQALEQGAMAGMELFALGGGIALGLAVITLVGLFISYLLPAAVLGFLKNSSFKEAFNFKVVFKKAFNRKYLITWLIVLVIGIIIGLITGLFAGIDIIYMIVGSAGGFIQYVIMYTLFGDVYQKIR